MVRVSILIPAYNAEPFIARAIESVLQQDLPARDYEILVVDDGSVDQTRERIKAFQGKVTLFPMKHGGLAQACNTALSHATGTYFTRLDADDTLAPNALSTMTTLMDNDPTLGVVYADYTEIDPSGHQKRVAFDRFNVFRMLACGILFRTSVANAIEGYSELLFEEYDFLIRYLNAMPKTLHAPLPLYNYYRHGENMTQKAGYWEKGWKEFIAKWGEAELSKWNFREVYHP